MEGFEVYVGLDVGKSFHHIYAVSNEGEVLADRRISQIEQELVCAFERLTAKGSVLVVVDQPNNIGSLPLSCARRTGCEVAYLPGLAMRRAAGLFPGDAKTDARDAYIICMTARCMPVSLRLVPEHSVMRAELIALSSFDEDCRCDTTREINRLRAHLVEAHPAFEAALKDDVASPFVLKLLQRYGGPWGICKAGRSRVEKWAAGQKRVPKALLTRLLDAAFSMDVRPSGATLREEFGIPACARRIADLIKARAAIEKRIREMLKEDLVFAVLMSMPGVGYKTATTFIVCVDIDRFASADKLASYAGIAPKTHQSGTSIKSESAARIGNRALKNALFLSAFASLRADPFSKQYYDKKRAEGKGHNAAIICLARRRLKIMYAMVRDVIPYRAVA